MRLDRAIAERGLARSRSHAAELISQGKVTVDGIQARRPAQPVTPTSAITVDDDGWVSRAAHKLLGALADLDLTPRGRVLDAGASTGGFTQVLLTHPVERIYAVDVGHDQLHASLRADSRVTVAEGLNLRALTLDDVGGQQLDWLVADVSFISLRLLLEPLLAVLADDADALVMVKPQFEVGRNALGKNGVVRDPHLRAAAVDDVVAHAATLGWVEQARVRSQLAGPAGNHEFFCWLRRASFDGHQTRSPTS